MTTSRVRELQATMWTARQSGNSKLVVHLEEAIARLENGQPSCKHYVLKEQHLVNPFALFMS